MLWMSWLKIEVKQCWKVNMKCLEVGAVGEGGIL